LVLAIAPLFSLANSHFTDQDGDGLSDEWELRNGLPPDVKNANADVDKDGLSNLEEQTERTDPLSADTDGDGILDGEEVRAGTDPRNPKLPTAFKLSYLLIGAPVAILLSFILFYLVSIAMRAVGKNQIPMIKKPSQPQYVKQPTQSVQPVQRQYIPQINPSKIIPVTQEQLARARNAVFSKFSQVTKQNVNQKKPKKMKQPKQPSKLSRDEQALQQLGVMAKKSKVPMDDLKRLAKKQS